MIHTCWPREIASKPLLSPLFLGLTMRAASSEKRSTRGLAVGVAVGVDVGIEVRVGVGDGVAVGTGGA